MATVRTRCKEHGDLELDSHSIESRLFIHAKPYGRLETEDTYSFKCTIGGETITQQADPRTIDLLKTSGIRVIPVDNIHDALVQFPKILEGLGAVEVSNLFDPNGLAGRDNGT